MLPMVNIRPCHLHRLTGYRLWDHLHCRKDMNQRFNPNLVPRRRGNRATGLAAMRRCFTLAIFLSFQPNGIAGDFWLFVERLYLEIYR